jgi:hypothetical protein
MGRTKVFELNAFVQFKMALLHPKSECHLIGQINSFVPVINI